jgi:dihydrofolate reductase
MRKVVSYFVHSLDGVVEDPQDWVFDRFDDEMLGHLKALIDRQDTVLLGRTTYEEWLPYWPTSTHEPFASFINSTPKYVASTTLDEVTWQNSTLIKGSVADKVASLKEQPGGDIGVHGSATLVRSLLRDGVLDELKLAVFPVVAGRGRRLFEDIGQVQRLRLADVTPTGKGVLVLTYRADAG